MSDTVVRRIELASGEVDALHAVRFDRCFPPHFHETWAVGVIEEGSVGIRTPSGAWTARAGSILAFAPGEVHAATPANALGWSYRMVYPGRPLLEELGAGSETGTRLRAAVIADGALASALQRDLRRLMRPRRDRRAEGAVLRRLEVLIERHGARESSDEEARPACAEAIERGKRLLQDNLGGTIRVEEVASACGLSLFHFVRSFRRVVGVPPHAYLVMLRVNRARRMLREGEGVSRVAFACGFSDQSHLTRTFKRVVGVPPGRYALATRAAAPS